MENPTSELKDALESLEWRIDAIKKIIGDKSEAAVKDQSVYELTKKCVEMYGKLVTLCPSLKEFWELYDSIDVLLSEIERCGSVSYGARASYILDSSFLKGGKGPNDVEMLYGDKLKVEKFHRDIETNKGFLEIPDSTITFGEDQLLRLAKAKKVHDEQMLACDELCENAFDLIKDNAQFVNSVSSRLCAIDAFMPKKQ